MKYKMLGIICRWLSNIFDASVGYSPYPTRRVSGHCICSFCNREYYDHVALHRLCEGELVKL